MIQHPGQPVPLSRQLLVRVAVFSLLLTLGASLLNAWLSWQAEQRRQQVQLQAVLAAYGPGLARAAWLRDDTALGLQLAGLHHFPAVLSAEVVGPQLRHAYAKAGANLGQDSEASSHPLVAPDGRQVAGYLLLRLDTELLTGQVWRDTAVFVAATAVELLLLAALLYTVVLRTVSQPLAELSRHVVGLTTGRFDRLDVPVPQPGHGPPHEVHALAQGIERLQDALRDQLAHRDANAQALQQRRDQLNALIARQTRQLDEVLLHMADGAGVVDALGVVIVANPAWGRIMGLAEGDALEGWPAPRWLARPGWIHLLGLLQGREAQAVTTIGVRRADGSEVPVEASFSVVERSTEGRPQRIQLVLRDISVRLETERNLIAAREAALAATRAKSEFLANMSHEIRTPMNAILGMLHLALRTALSPQQRDYLHKIHAAARSLLGLINDILDFSKIEAGKLELAHAEFAVDDVLEQVTSLVALQAQAKGLEFLIDTAPDVPPRLVGDALRLAQVLTNLCNNAVKFTDRGEVIVATRVVPLADGGGDDDAHPAAGHGAGPAPGEPRVRLHFAIIDSGIGMSAEQMGQLFRPFTQVDASSSRRHGGTGLGLAISRQLVQLMGGDIRVQSTPDEGSAFSFTADFDCAAAVPDAEPRPGAMLDLLVVDVRPRAAAVLCATAGGLGCRTAQVATLDAACAALLAAAGRNPFDLVLLDAGGGGGAASDAACAAARRVRALPLRLPPRVVALLPFGNDGRDGDAEGGMSAVARAAFDGVLTKPVNASSLLDLLCRLFAERGFLPLRRSGRSAIAPAAPAPERLRRLDGLRVLLAEDNPINREVAVALLAEVGVRLTCADNGLEALRRLDEQPPAAPFDLVLMDVQMPGMDGLEATRCMRERAEHRHLPVIAITAHAMARDREQCLAAGMNDFISKPFEPADLYATLARWVPEDRAPGAAPDAPPRAAAAASAGATPAAPATPAPAPSGLPREVRGIVLTEGLRHCDGKPALYRRMLGLFARSRADLGPALRKGLAAGDIAGMAKLVHMVKGEAGTLGARAVFTTAAALEAELAAMLAAAPAKAGAAPPGHGAGAMPAALAPFEAALAEVLDGLADALSATAAEAG